MSKEESSLGIVRVGVRLTELVMDPVVSDPDVDGVLSGHAVGHDQEEAEGQTGLERAMSPESMSSSCDTLTWRHSKNR